MIPALLSCLVDSGAARFVEMQPLAKDVYAAVRKEPPGFAVDCNVLFVVREKDVVMVDANIGPESVTATLDALKKVTKKPISTIIATHYHDDHMGGVNTVRERFPKVRLIAHSSSVKAIPDLLDPARKGMIEIAPQMSAYLGSLIQKGQSYSGGALSLEEKASYRNDIRIAERYAKEMPGIPLPKPDTLVSDRLVLNDGGKQIEILHLGAGHTPSDLVVWLPDERIAASGDLLIWPVPLVGDKQSDVVAWPKTLERLHSLGAEQILPGHGPVMHNSAYLRQMQSLMEEITKQVRGAKAAGKTLAQMQADLKFEKQRDSFAGSSQLRRVLFEEYVRKPSITAADRLITP